MLMVQLLSAIECVFIFIILHPAFVLYLWSFSCNIVYFSIGLVYQLNLIISVILTKYEDYNYLNVQIAELVKSLGVGTGSLG